MPQLPLDDLLRHALHRRRHIGMQPAALRLAEQPVQRRPPLADFRALAPILAGEAK